MALKEYYAELGTRSTPCKEFRDRLVNECGVKPMTVFRWLSGEVIPDKLKREKISEIAGIPVEELFPNLNDRQDETM